jgi:hypothetical protein
MRELDKFKMKFRGSHRMLTKHEFARGFPEVARAIQKCVRISGGCMEKR